MIANISPSSVSAQETLSTLQFMSRAKCIRNRAQINLDARGDVVLLQREIVRLNLELDNLRKGHTEPAVQEAKELREKLDRCVCVSHCVALPPRATAPGHGGGGGGAPGLPPHQHPTGVAAPADASWRGRPACRAGCVRARARWRCACTTWRRRTTT
jgi:hypothetical protein